MLLGVNYVEADYFRAPYRYVLADAVAASTAIVIVGAVVSLAAAIQMSVIVDTWGRLDVRRSMVSVYLRQLLPAVGIGLAAMATIYGVFVGTGLTQIDRLGLIMLVSVVSIVAWACFGSLAGLWLAPVVAYPLSILVPLFLTSFPVAWEPLWVRHLTGALFDCCGEAQVLNPDAVAGSVLAGAALAAGSVGLSIRRMSPGRRPTLAVIGLVAASAVFGLASVGMVRDLGAFPTSSRPPDEVVCQGNVCVWEEAHPSLDANAQAFGKITDAWVALGLPIDGPVVVHPSGADAGLRLAVATEDPQRVLTQMVALFPAELSRCSSSGGESSGTTAYDPTADRLSWLLGVELGLPAEQIAHLLLDSEEVSRSDATRLWEQLADCAS